MFGRTLRGGRIVVNPAEQSVLFRVGLIPEVPPASTVADCPYETSDITTINHYYRTTIPEPSTAVLLASGLAGVAWLSRRRRSAEPE